MKSFKNSLLRLKLSPNEFLPKDNPFAIHNRNIPSLSIEICKFLNVLYHNDGLYYNKYCVFKQNQSIPYKLRNCNTFRIRRANSETTPYLSLKIGNIVLDRIKNSKSLESLKLKIRKWKPECPCRLCKTYLKHVGFIWRCLFFFFSPSQLRLFHLTCFEIEVTKIYFEIVVNVLCKGALKAYPHF